MEIFAFWILLAIVVAIAAGSRGRNGGGWFILSVFLSPLIGLILVLVLPNLRQERLLARVAAGSQRGAFEPQGVYGDIPYRVRGDGSVEALMQGGVVRFRSADHMFESLHGGATSVGTSDVLNILNVPSPQPKLMLVGKLSIVIVCFCVIAGFVLHFSKLAYDRASAASEQAIESQNSDATGIAKAAEVNSKWEAAFDKTGKYPEGENAESHNSAFGSVVSIAPESPSYNAARTLVDKFAVRQIKINAVEKAKSPPPPEKPKIRLGSLDSSYNSIKGSFSIDNPNAFAVADVQMNCNAYGASGTVISEYNFTIYEVVAAKGTKTVKGYDFGYSPSQAKSLSCRSTGYARR